MENVPSFRISNLPENGSDGSKKPFGASFELLEEKQPYAKDSYDRRNEGDHCDKVIQISESLTRHSFFWAAQRIVHKAQKERHQKGQSGTAPAKVERKSEVAPEEEQKPPLAKPTPEQIEQIRKLGALGKKPGDRKRSWLTSLCGVLTSKWRRLHS